MATIAQLSVDISANLDDLKKGLAEANSRLEGLEKNVNSSGGKMNNVFGKLGGAIAGAFTVGAIVQFGEKVIDITGEFQKLQAVLNNTLGSQSEGQIAFAQIQDFAAKTNFSVLELTQSFVGLANRGLRPNQTNLQALADVANSLGKPLDDVVQAVLDVTNTERWTELGIKVTKAGDQITAKFREQTVTAKATEQGALDLITAIGQFKGVAGATTAISQTLTGATSNLGDSLNTLFSTIGNRGSGVMIEFIQALNNGVNAITRMIASSEDLKQQGFLSEVGKEADKLKERIDALTKSNEDLGIENARNAAINQLLADSQSNLAKLQKDLVANSEAAKEATSINIQTYRDLDKEISNSIILEEKRISVLNEMTAAANAVNASNSGLLAALKAQIKAQQDANEAAKDTGALAAGQARVQNLQEQLDALQKLGTQNSLEIVTDKLDKYYQVLGNPDATNAAVANAAKLVRALESEREALQNATDARVSQLVPQDLQNLQSLKPNLPTGSTFEGDLSINPDRFLSQDTLDAIKSRFGDLREVMSVSSEDVINVSESLRNGLAGAFAGLGELIGNALSGTIDSAGSFFNALLGIVASFLKQFGASLISAGIAALAFQNLLSNPYAAIIAGIAVIAAATVVQNLLSKGPGGGARAMASGGIVYGPTHALVGEYAGARNNPEVVAPLNKLQSMLAGGAYPDEIMLRADGESLTGVLRRYDMGRDRRGGG